LSLLPSEFNEMSRNTSKEFLGFMESLSKWFLAEFTIFSDKNTIDLTKEVTFAKSEEKITFRKIHLHL
jgi:hypothetical protein